MSGQTKNSGIPWIGEIPYNWRIEIIGSCIKEVDCKNSDCSENNALQFKMGTIIPKKNGDSKYNPETLEAYNKVQAGDIVINGLNLSFDFVSQRVGLVKETGVITSAYLAVRPLSFIDSRFLTYLFKGYDTCKALHSMGKGLRQTLGYKEFRRYYVVFPNLEEQQRIADFLDKKCNEIDEMVALQEQIIEELKAYKQAVVTEATTHGLNPNARMKTSGIEWIGEIPVDWEIKMLGSLFYEHKQQNKGLIENNLLSLSYGKIIRKDINTNGGLLPMSFEGYNIIGKDDIVLRMTDLQNDHKSLRTGLCNERGIITSAYITLRPKIQLNSKYIHYLLHTYDVLKVFYGMGDGVRQSIGFDDIRKLLIFIPSAKEQDEICNYLDQKSAEIDNLVAIKQQKIEELKEYKKSIIYEYITGKKEII